MNIFCRLGQHRAVPGTLWNDGYYFSACARCGKELVRVPGGRWTTIPPNMRVVWRERTEEDIVWPPHIL